MTSVKDRRGKHLGYDWKISEIKVAHFRLEGTPDPAHGNYQKAGSDLIAKHGIDAVKAALADYNDETYRKGGYGF